MVGLDDKVYVTFTCKKCNKAFLDVDINNDINEEPLRTRYCPDCVAKGFKNKKINKISKKEKERNEVIKQRLEENNITDKKDIQFIKKYIKNQIIRKESNKQPVYINYIFNDALVILSYQDWKQGE